MALQSDLHSFAMSRHVQIVSAASIAHCTEQLDPKNDQAMLALLDLSKDASKVAASKIDTILTALGPRLFLQKEYRLIVSTGALGPLAAARLGAGALDPRARKSIQIGVVQGEDLTDRIEELALQGCHLTDENSGRRLVDEPFAPTHTWSPAPVAPLLSALREGAQVLFTRSADPGTAAIAAVCDVFNLSSVAAEVVAQSACVARVALKIGAHMPVSAPLAIVREEGSASVQLAEKTKPQLEDLLSDKANLPDVSYDSGSVEGNLELTYPRLTANRPASKAEVLSTMPAGAELILTLSFSKLKQSNLSQVIEALQLATPEGIAFDATHSSLRLHTIDAEYLSEVAQRLELVCGELGLRLERPLAESIRPCYIMRGSRAPRELLEYTSKTRSALDWLE